MAGSHEVRGSSPLGSTSAGQRHYRSPVHTRELGSQFGIQQSIIDDLIRQVLAYIRSLNAIPSSITTTVGINTPSEISGGLQHGAIIAAASGLIASQPILVGEGRYATPFGSGAEAVLPLNDRTMDRLGASVARHMPTTGGGSIVVHVHGDVLSENQLIDKIHDGLIRKGRRGDTLGLG